MLALEGLVNVWLSRTANTNRFYWWYLISDSKQLFYPITAKIQICYTVISSRIFARIVSSDVEDRCNIKVQVIFYV